MSDVYLAYDGSIHGDWVFHYAVRLAARSTERNLHLVHVLEPSADKPSEERIDRIGVECRRLDVDLEVNIRHSTGTVVQTICSSVPPGPDNYLVCGTRSESGRRGLLSGSVSERLLRLGRVPVLALRVVQPGLLGLPRRLLLPVSGHPRGFRSGTPFMKLLAGDASRLHVLYVERVGRGRFRTLSHASAERLLRTGQAYCERIERELRDQLGSDAGVVDTQVVVSDDVPKEIVITANKTKSRLIYLGASERNLRERFFFGNPIEQVLREATCDVAIYRGLE